MTEIKPLLEESTDIAAPPERVWAVLGDLTAMARLSPQVKRTWVRGGTTRQGARFVNLNHKGWKHWPTSARVVDYVPEQRIAFRITENRTIWSYTLEPVEVDGVPGTHVVHRREAPDGISKLSTSLVSLLLGGQKTFTADLERGMQQTLGRLKAEVEAGGVRA